MKNKPLLIYTAGPYRAQTPQEVDQNILTARGVAVKVWEKGHYALCPHLNANQFERLCGVPDSQWLKGDLIMLVRCDAILMVEGWEKSTGSKQELAHAIEHGLRVFYDLTEIPQLEI